MIKIKGTISVALLKKEVFTGSDDHMAKRFLLRQSKNEQEETVIEAVAWKGPYIYEKSPKEEMLKKEFPFTAEGIDLAVDWLNSIEMNKSAL